MKKGFGEQIAEHRKQFVMADHPLTKTPEDSNEWETVDHEPEQLELMRYQTTFGDLNIERE